MIAHHGDPASPRLTRRALLHRAFAVAVAGSGLLAACTSAPPASAPAKSAEGAKPAEAANPTAAAKPGAAVPTQAPAAKAEGKRGGTLIYGQSGDPTTFDTVKATGNPALFASNQIYDHLINIGPDGKYLPALAASWEIAPDLKTYTFKLRSGVKFHDGTEFNAAAVKFNYERFKDKEVSGMAAQYDVIETIEAPDPLTVIFRLSQPRVAFLEENVGEWRAGIASPAAIEKAGKEYGLEPVGTGPWKFVEWNPDDRTTYERNADFWGDAPLLDKLVVRAIPDNQTRALEMERGSVHISFKFPPEQIAKFKTSSDLVLQPASSLTIRGWQFNLKKPIFQDPRVRRAFYHAVDIDTIINTQLGETAVRSQGPVYVKSPALNPAIKEPEYNPERAKALFAEAGWTPGSDGVLTKGGERMDLVLLFGTGLLPKGKEMDTAFQQYLAKVGVAIKLDEREYATYLKATEEMKHDITTLAIGPRSPDPVLTALDVGFHSKGRLNRSGYANPQLDELLAKGSGVANMEERNTYYYEAQEIIMRDLPAIFTYNDVDIAVVRKNVQGYTHSTIQERNLLNKVSLA